MGRVTRAVWSSPEKYNTNIIIGRCSYESNSHNTIESNSTRYSHSTMRVTSTRASHIFICIQVWIFIWAWQSLFIWAQIWADSGFISGGLELGTRSFHDPIYSIAGTSTECVHVAVVYGPNWPWFKLSQTNIDLDLSCFFSALSFIIQ